MSAPFSIFNTRSATDPQQNQSVGVTTTGVTTTYSEPWTGEDCSGYGLSIFTTGTLAGTFTRFTTNKPLPSYADDSDWIPDAGFAPTNPAGAPVRFADNNTADRASKKRLKYVNASGTGTITGFVNVTKTN